MRRMPRLPLRQQRPPLQQLLPRSLPEALREGKGGRQLVVVVRAEPPRLWVVHRLVELLLLLLLPLQVAPLPLL